MTPAAHFSCDHVMKCNMENTEQPHCNVELDQPCMLGTLLLTKIKIVDKRSHRSIPGPNLVIWVGFVELYL